MEGSKLFSKQLMERAGIPTAAYGSFTDEASALAYVREQGAPLVVKADGLAAGKGVIVATELEQAEEAVRECFGGTFGDAGNTVVIEEMLVGPECSLLAFTDGKTVRPMATSQDHKRALEGDKGPNTGGMGVYSPVPIVTDEEHATMVAVMEQTVAELAAEGIDYRGCLYGGFMLTPPAPRCWSSMPALATPRRRSCCRASRTTWSRLCSPAPTASLIRLSSTGATSGPWPLS